MMSRDPYDAPAKAETDSNRRYISEKEQRRIRKAIAYAMSTPKGREAIEVVLTLSQMYTPSFSTNALTMAFNEGRRSVGISLTSLIDPLSYQLMLKESNERRNNEPGD